MIYWLDHLASFVKHTYAVCIQANGRIIVRARYVKRTG